jgi:hypothetical protein
LIGSLGRRRRGLKWALQETESWQGESATSAALWPRTQGKHCYEVRRGPIRGAGSQGIDAQQARSAALAFVERSDTPVVALLEEAARLPRQDVSMQWSMGGGAGSGSEPAANRPGAM